MPAGSTEVTTADRTLARRPRQERLLIGLTAALGVGELVSAVAIAVEDYADAQPAFAVLFAALFFLTAGLVWAARTTAGAVLAAVLCLFEVVAFPTWQRHNAFDWASGSVFAVLALVTLIVAVVVLVRRR